MSLLCVIGMLSTVTTTSSAPRSCWWRSGGQHPNKTLWCGNRIIVKLDYNYVTPEKLRGDSSKTMRDSIEMTKKECLIGPKTSTGLDDMCQPFYIGGAIANDKDNYIGRYLVPNEQVKWICNTFTTLVLVPSTSSINFQQNSRRDWQQNVSTAAVMWRPINLQLRWTRQQIQNSAHPLPNKSLSSIKH